MAAGRFSRRLGWCLAVALLAGLAALGWVSWRVGDALSVPQRQAIGDPPPALHASAVVIATAGGDVHAWFAPGRVGAGAVLLLHGVRADRRAMLPRALALQRQGYAVLLMDLPAHGESAGERITYGRDEGVGVRHALQWLRTRLPGEKVGVIGASLGGAALLLSNTTPAPDAVVLEAVFPTIDAAVANRIHVRVGALSQVLTPLLVWQLPVRLGVDPAQLRPIEKIASLQAPVLVVGGANDMLTTQAETQQLFDAARSPKQLWVVPGAGHVDLYAYAPTEYAVKVFGFLHRYLQKP